MATGRSETALQCSFTSRRTRNFHFQNFVLVPSIQEAVLRLFQLRKYPDLAQDLHQLNDKLKCGTCKLAGRAGQR